MIMIIKILTLKKETTKTILIMDITNSTKTMVATSQKEKKNQNVIAENFSSVKKRIVKKTMDMIAIEMTIKRTMAKRAILAATKITSTTEDLTTDAVVQDVVCATSLETFTVKFKAA